MIIPSLPLHAEFEAWRYTVMSNILSASARPDETMAFLNEIDQPSVPMLRCRSVALHPWCPWIIRYLMLS